MDELINICKTNQNLKYNSCSIFGAAWVMVVDI